MPPAKWARASQEAYPTARVPDRHQVPDDRHRRPNRRRVILGLGGRLEGLRGVQFTILFFPKM